jgi:predicted TIM-barrel fold metal-dependent hydrolase
MIIDCNTHITRDGKWFHTAHDASLNRLLNEVKNSDVDAALVVPLPGTITNVEQDALLVGHESLVFSGATFNPALFANPQEAGEAFRREFSERKKTFVKFHNRFGKYHPNDERFLEVMKVNDVLETPMVIGVCGLLHDRNTTNAVDTAMYFFDLAKKMQRSNLIIMHGGGTQILRIAELCRDLHHVYFDLSMTLSKYKETSVAADISWLCKHYDRRMIWGSDFPEASLQQALIDFDETVGTLAEEKRWNILGKNIQQLLNLEVKTKT